MKSIAIWGINLYQKYLSPYKGYRCAYGVYHQNGTCSSIIKAHIQEHGLIKAYPMIKDQFSACKVAYFALQENSSTQPRCASDQKEEGCVCDSCCCSSSQDDKKKKKNDSSCDPCSGCGPDIDVCDCGDIGFCDIGGGCSL